jgi:hypothetical protein
LLFITTQFVDGLQIPVTLLQKMVDFLAEYLFFAIFFFFIELKIV